MSVQEVTLSQLCQRDISYKRFPLNIFSNQIRSKIMHLYCYVKPFSTGIRLENVMSAAKKLKNNLSYVQELSNTRRCCVRCSVLNCLNCDALLVF